MRFNALVFATLLVGGGVVGPFPGVIAARAATPPADAVAGVVAPPAGDLAAIVPAAADDRPLPRPGACAPLVSRFPRIAAQILCARMVA